MKTILVHGSMKYRCETCGETRTMWLEKGLEDRKSDVEYPSEHKPVPFIIRCPACSGLMNHVERFNDKDLGSYVPLSEIGPNADYFANKDDIDCGKPVFHDKGTLVHDGLPIGRNDPCPCGSGKKYKRCCGR